MTKYIGRLGELYCPLCEKLERLEKEQLVSLRREVHRLRRKRKKGNWTDVDEESLAFAEAQLAKAQAKFAEVEQEHPCCSGCGILLGDGHICKEIYQLDGRVYCADCAHARNRTVQRKA